MKRLLVDDRGRRFLKRRCRAQGCHAKTNWVYLFEDAGFAVRLCPEHRREDVELKPAWKPCDLHGSPTGRGRPHVLIRS